MWGFYRPGNKSIQSLPSNAFTDEIRLYVTTVLVANTGQYECQGETDEENMWTKNKVLFAARTTLVVRSECIVYWVVCTHPLLTVLLLYFLLWVLLPHFKLLVSNVSSTLMQGSIFYLVSISRPRVVLYEWKCVKAVTFYFSSITQVHL